MNDEKTEEAERLITEGEYRVGISFNPEGHGDVNVIKALSAQLIDYVLEHANDPRTAAIAATGFEDAAMWAVESVTKPDRPVHLK